MFVTFVVPLSKMAGRRNPVVSVLVFLQLMVVKFPGAKCSEVNHVYALPPPSMLHEHLNASAATVQDVHVVKPPEILLKNSLLQKVNASQHLQQDKPLPTSNPSSSTGTPAGPPSAERRDFHPSPPIIPKHDANKPSQMPFDPRSMSLDPTPSNINHNTPFPINPTNFPSPHHPTQNGTNHVFNPDPFTSFNDVDQFVNFVPLDYENGQMYQGIIPPHQKREAQRANRRAGQGPPPRRNSTSPIKNIISSFHEKFSRMIFGPRRRGPPKPMQRQPAVNSQQNVRNTNERIFDPVELEGARTFDVELPEAPTSANDHTFAAALNTVAQILKDNQYIPLLGKRERVRTLSQDESQHLDSLRRRDRKVKRRPPRRRYPPRKKRPYYRPFEEDAPPKYHRDREPPYHHEEEEDYYSKSKYNRFPKHFNDDFGPHKDHGPPYKGFKSFKAFKPWKPNFESYEDHEEYRQHEGYHRAKKPAWHIDSHEKESYNRPNKHQSRPHYLEHYREHPEVQNSGFKDSNFDTSIFKDTNLETSGFKPIITKTIKPEKFKNWDEKKVKFQKVIDYDSDLVGLNHFSSLKHHGASVTKDEDARIPKIIINHHHNLPPASTGASFLPGAFPGNTISYSPPIHHYHHPDFFPGSGRGRGRGKKEYRSTEFADSFIVNDYGKPPMSAYGMPPPMVFPPARPPPMHHGGPPPGPPIAASPPMGGHMVFDHFAQNMPPHFMNGKMPAPNLNQGPFVGHPAGPHPHAVSYSTSHFPRPMIPRGHYPQQVSPGFPAMGQHFESADTFGKPSQMASYNDMNEGFPQHAPPGFHNHEGGPDERHPGPPPGDSSPFPSTNEQHHDANDFIPPFTPVPNKEDQLPPTQGPITPTSRESFFNMKRPRKKVPRKFEFKIVKTLSSGFEIPEKLTKHPLAEPKPTPIMNYFDLGVPDREHYKQKEQKKQNRGNSNKPSNKEDQYHRQSSLPKINNNHNNKFESNEFNYSTLPENWNSFRPDPSHKRLPSLTHAQHDPPEIGSRINKFSALNPKNLVNAIMRRFPGARRVDNANKPYIKFTPYDAKSREVGTLMGASNRKRRKSTKAPASIQDIINSDSSNHNKAIVVTISDDNDELNNNDIAQNDHYEGGASSSSPVIVRGKGRAKSPKSRLARRKKKHRVSNEIQTEMPFTGEIEDEVLLGMHNINIPLTAQIRMGEEADEKKKKK